MTQKNIRHIDGRDVWVQSCWLENNRLHANIGISNGQPRGFHNILRYHKVEIYRDLTYTYPGVPDTRALGKWEKLISFEIYDQFLREQFSLILALVVSLLDEAEQIRWQQLTTKETSP